MLLSLTFSSVRKTSTAVFFFLLLFSLSLSLSLRCCRLILFDVPLIKPSKRKKLFKLVLHFLEFSIHTNYIQLSCFIFQLLLDKQKLRAKIERYHQKLLNIH